MSGAIPPFPQYEFTAWCSVKAHGELYLHLLQSLLLLDFHNYILKHYKNISFVLNEPKNYARMTGPKTVELNGP